MRPHPATLLLILSAAAAFGFAAFSTYDFVAHLDRQVHGIHCSFLPGLTDANAGDSAGCQATLMSAYSSVLRDRIWGGIPVSLPAMAVFGFLFFWGLWLILHRRQADVRAASFTVLATALPLATSLVMGYLSLYELGAVCKLCIGIYVSSTVAFTCACLLLSHARRQRRLQDPQSAPGDVSMPALALAFVLGLAFVVLPVASYANNAPDFSHYIGSCGQMEYATDARVLVPLGDQSAPLEMVEVLDPLCPSCRGFERRFAEMDAREEVRRAAVLFPLDDACNWMIDDAIHPGACAISEAILCAGPQAEAVLAWSFEHQESILEAARQDAKAAGRMVVQQFPQLRSCVGSPAAAAKLNLALRWAVKNRLLVLTPQVYVGGLRLCDEDTDLGLDYALPRLIAQARTLPPRKAAPDPLPTLTPIARAPTRAKRAAEPKAPAKAAEPDDTQGSAAAPEPSDADDGPARLAPEAPSTPGKPAEQATATPHEGAPEPGEPPPAPAEPPPAPEDEP